MTSRPAWLVAKDGLAWEVAPSAGDLAIRLRFERVDEGHDEIKADILIEGPSVHRRERRVNLLSGRSIDALGKSLGGEWAGWLRGAIDHLIEAFREGEPGVEIDVDLVTVHPVRYLIAPLLPYKEPAILFGPAGVSKSYIALAIACSVGTGRCFVPDMTIDPDDRGRVLYLDYEMSAEMFGVRVKRLLFPHNIGGRPGVVRLAMTRPVALDIERVAREAAKINAALIVIDPAGPAAGAGSEWVRDDAKAESMFSALREIGTTSLIIDHTTKAELRNGGKGTGAPIGTVVKYNRARSVWEARRSDESKDSTLFVSLTNWKASDDRTREPMGIQIEHSSTGVTFTRADLSAMADAAQSASITTLIRECLREKAMTPTELIESLDRPPNTVRSGLRRLAGHQEIVKLSDGAWQLVMSDVPGGQGQPA